jgi:hypothetical protein
MAWRSHPEAPRPITHPRRHRLGRPGPRSLPIVAVVAAAVLLPHPETGRTATAPPPVPAVLAMPAVQGRAVQAAAIELASRFGMNGTAGPVVRAVDQISGAVTDTVEFRDPDARLAAVVSRGTDGSLVRVIDLTDSPHTAAPALDAADVPAAARRLLDMARLVAPSSAPGTTWDAGMDAWCVRWERSIGGVPAPTDALVTWVRPDGRLKALSDLSSPLAPPSAHPIPAAAAAAAVRAYAAQQHLDRLPSLSYEAPRLEWILPDGFVDPAEAQAGPVLRLAWAVRFSYVPPGWQDRHIVELDVDAATGALIGGTETA